MLYLGNITGPLIASRFALHESKTLLIRGLFFECGLSIFLLLYISLCMPESLHYKTISKLQEPEATLPLLLESNNEMNNPTATTTTTAPTTATTKSVSIGSNLRRNNIFSAISFLFCKGRRTRAILASIFLVNFIILISFLRVSFVYTGLKYHWKAADFDQFSSLGRGLPMAVGAWMLAGCFGHTPSWKTQVRLITIGSIGVILRLIGGALATSSKMFYVSGMFNVFSGLYTPLLRSTLSESASETNQGLLLTGIAGIETCTGIFAPLALGYLYAQTEATDPEFALYFMAGMGVISLALSCWLFQYDENGRE